MPREALKRPEEITWIALFLFCGAGFLLLLMGAVYVRPEALSNAGPSLRLLISIATNHFVTTTTHLDSKSTAVAVLFPVYAIISAVFGCGLWFLNKWARYLLLARSGIALVLYVRAVLIRGWAFGGGWALGQRDPLAGQTYALFALVNAMIFWCLLQAKGAFGDDAD